MPDFGEGLDRRLPVYLLLDCSSSMSGDPIEAVRTGVKTIVDELKGDPMALQTVWLSVITFDSSTRQVVPLTEIGAFVEPPIVASGGTSLGAALNLFGQCIDRDVRKATATQKGDWKPLMFLLTDGQPTDSWEAAADAVRKRTANIIACGAGHGVNTTNLKRITEIVLSLATTQPDDIKMFFKWVTQSIKITGTSVSSHGSAKVALAPPPQGIVLVP